MGAVWASAGAGGVGDLEREIRNGLGQPECHDSYKTAVVAAAIVNKTKMTIIAARVCQ